MDWELRISFYWPHHRMLLGWDMLYVDEAYDYNTIKLHLLIVTFELDF